MLSLKPAASLNHQVADDEIGVFQLNFVRSQRDLPSKSGTKRDCSRASNCWS